MCIYAHMCGLCVGANGSEISGVERKIFKICNRKTSLFNLKGDRSLVFCIIGELGHNNYSSKTVGFPTTTTTPSCPLKSPHLEQGKHTQHTPEDFGEQQTLVQITILPLTCCKILDMCLSQSKLQFP